jgi:hypothetical protein
MMMDYFHNDTESLTVGGMSFENGKGSVAFHGSITIRPDNASLTALRALCARLADMEKALVGAIDEGLSVEDMSTTLEIVDNPFA